MHLACRKQNHDTTMSIVSWLSPCGTWIAWWQGISWKAASHIDISMSEVVELPMLAQPHCQTSFRPLPFGHLWSQVWVFTLYESYDYHMSIEIVNWAQWKCGFLFRLRPLRTFCSRSLQGNGLWDVSNLYAPLHQDGNPPESDRIRMSKFYLALWSQVQWYFSPPHTNTHQSTP